ncbi:MAG: hypothetical protein NC489_40740 [Ruminococcus flavefaciens]|nr:hypothetical protein [Ruminococcus flavefaciens]
MDWVESQNIGYITISRENQPIVGISNTGSFTLLGNVQRDLNITWMYFYQVKFADAPDKPDRLFGNPAKQRSDCGGGEDLCGEGLREGRGDQRTVRAAL